MGRQAHHHYIPRTYLKGFTIRGENSSPFWGVPINGGTTFQTTPNDACSKRDYYSVEHEDSLIVENYYSKEIEPKIGLILHKLKQKIELSSNSDMDDLTLLLATLYLRPPSFREVLEAPMRQAKKIAESISKDVKVTNLHEFDYSQNDLIAHELKLIEVVKKYLSNKYFKFFKSDEYQEDFITSDMPFLLNHPNDNKKVHFGLNTPGVEICVPLTRKIVLVAQNEPLNEGVFSANEKIIALVNRNIMLSANRFYFSSRPGFLFADDEFNIHKNSLI